MNKGIEGEGIGMGGYRLPSRVRGMNGGHRMLRNVKVKTINTLTP